MAMKFSSAPRRVYPRAGSLVCTIAGKFFGPKAGKKTAIDHEVEVTTQVLKAAGGVDRIQVTQFLGAPNEVSETWTTKVVVFKKRAPKAAPAASEPAEAVSASEEAVPA